MELDLQIEPPPITRVLVWFSAGATSAIALALALVDNAGKLPLRALYCETGSHHADNLRFLREVSEWLKCPIEIVRNHKYRDVDDVIEKERYLNGPDGAKCTQQLKIRVRKELQNAGSDLQVFGFHAGEMDRAADYRQHWPEVRLACPLIGRNLFHDDCLAMLRDARIEIPEMYRMGYRNNNCPGCVKGGKGYWNKVRIDFPHIFARRAKQERTIGHSCIKGTFLDELDPAAGRYEAEPDIACEGHCVSARTELEACESGEAWQPTAPPLAVPDSSASPQPSPPLPSAPPAP